MAVVKDWTMDAARQIMLAYNLDRIAPQDLSVYRLAEIIARNCPFKKDTAYVTLEELNREKDKSYRAGVQDGQRKTD